MISEFVINVTQKSPIPALVTSSLANKLYRSAHKVREHNARLLSSIYNYSLKYGSIKPPLLIRMFSSQFFQLSVSLPVCWTADPFRRPQVRSGTAAVSPFLQVAHFLPQSCTRVLDCSSSRFVCSPCLCSLGCAGCSSSNIFSIASPLERRRRSCVEATVTSRERLICGGSLSRRRRNPVPPSVPACT